MLGQTIGKYRVVSRLGRGGMGTVYKAVDETLGREVAIKRLNSELTESEVLKRFRAEAITLARLNHPNIATLFELTEYQGELLMVMEFVRGDTFEQLCERVGALQIPRAVELCGQVFDALSHAHRVGVVHRDLKPANLMLAESGVVKVMDFGLARMAGSEHLTNDGYMVGTPAYMSPEQVAGGEVDGRADLYAMGVVLYRLVSGQLPFKAGSGIEMAHKQMYDLPTPVRQLRTELPPACEEILIRALAKAPEDRFQTADEFRAALAVLNGAASADATRIFTFPASGTSGSYLADSPTMTAISPVRTGVSSGPVTRSDSVPIPPSGPVMRSDSVPMPASVPVTESESVPVPPTVPSSSAPSTPTTPPGSRKRVAVAFAACALLLAAIPITVVVWRGRMAKSAAVAPAASAPIAQDAGAPVVPAASAPPVAPPPVVADAPAAPTASAPASPPSPRGGTPPSTTPSARQPKVATNVPAPAPPTETPAPAPEPAAPPRPDVPVVTFTKMKLLVFDDGKARDQNASLRLDADALHVMDGNSPIKVAAYRDVIGLYQSHSREPRWTAPDGTAVSVAKTGGKFSFLKGTPDWVTVRTKEGFIPLRVADGDLARVIAELEARTGTKFVRTR